MRIGVDLGGTKIEGVVLDDDGRVRALRRVPTPKDDAARVVEAIRTLVIALEREVDARCSVGVGTPGSTSPRTGLLRNSNTVCLNGTPLDRWLSEALERPVRIANDANCFALSEAVDGAARGARVVFGVIVGTGTGAGVVVDGRLVEGHHGVAGEWGHNPLPWPDEDEFPGPPCYCGKRGCLETWLSGPGLARWHHGTTGVELTAEAVALAASDGDAAAARSLDRYVTRMARGLATILHVLDPDVIVLGGGMSNVDGLAERVAEALPRWALSDYVDVPVVRAQHGDSGGVRGAAWLWS